MKVSHKKQKYLAKTSDILGGFKIKTPEETIQKIISDNCSITRFGDGEFDMICGVGMKYQKYNQELGKRLKEVLMSNEEGLLVGINNVIDLQYSENYNDFANNFWKKWLYDNKFKLLKLLSKNKQYYSSNITRFYIDYKDKSKVGDYVKELRKIWDKKDVLIVEDIIDTGLTLSHVKKLLEDRGAKSLKICTLLDKPSRRTIEMKGDYVGFEIPDEFVVGYGLDYDQHHRNLPYVGIVVKK